jgi:hypothetical protein
MIALVEFFLFAVGMASARAVKRRYGVGAAAAVLGTMVGVPTALLVLVPAFSGG